MADKEGPGSRWYIRNVLILYPDLIHLPLPGSYIFKISKTDRAVISLIRHHIGLEIEDVGNMITANTDPDKLVKFERDLPSINPLPGELIQVAAADLTTKENIDEISKSGNIHDVIRRTPDLFCGKFLEDNYTKQSTFRNKFYTEMQLSYKGHVTRKGDDKERYKSILTQFIRSYRHVCRDPKIRLPQDCTEISVILFGKADITEGDFAKDIESIMSQPRNVASDGFNFTITYNFQRLPGRPPEEAAAELKKFFSEGKQTTVAEDLLDRAKHSLHHRNHFRGSFLDAFSSAEIAVSKFMREFRKSRGIPENRIDEQEGEVGFSYKIKMELPTTIPDMSSDEKKLLDSIHGIRKTRNDMVHRGYDISEKDAQNAISIVSDLHNMLEKYAANFGINLRLIG